MEVPVVKRDKLKAKRKAEQKLIKERNKMIKMEKEIAEKRKAESEATATFEKTNVAASTEKGRLYTISVAVPGSILDNAQSPELRTYLAGQIARACVVFQVDEIVVYGDSCDDGNQKTTEGEFTGVGKAGNCNVQLARILQYLECPQYLRKMFFPKHRDLQYAGILNPLDCPHHMRIDDFMPYREGVVLDRPTKHGKGSFVDCGMRDIVQIDKVLQPNVRVTVKMSKTNKPKKHSQGQVVSPDTPRTAEGLYWGYTVRLASSLSTALVDCPFDSGKYDLTIGTSERGKIIDNFEVPIFKHVLIVFGGLQGIEAGLESDESLVGIDDPSAVFDHYLNTCPSQGSRTIRTEEAILITLSAFRPKVNQRFK